MRRNTVVVATLVAAAVTLGVPCVPAGAAPAPDPHCIIPTYDDRCETWATLYNDPEFGDASDQASRAAALSRDGSRLFVTGTDTDSRIRTFPMYGWITLALNTATGQKLWEAKGPLDNHAPADLAVSPDGTLVFVTGQAHSDDSQASIDQHMATVAYDADTGAVRWERIYDAAGTSASFGNEVEVSSDGSTVVVAGEAPQPGGGYALLVQAYDALSGTDAWSGFATATGGSTYVPVGLELGPSGDAAYVGATVSGNGGSSADFMAAAFSMRPDGASPAGSLLWQARYDGIGSHLADVATDAGLSPDGGRVYLTGLSQAGTSGAFFPDYDYATLAYDAATGAVLWSARFAGSKRFDTSSALAVSPAGDQIAVTGELSAGASSDMWFQYGTVSYDAATGAQRWVGKYGAPNDYHTAAFALGYSADSQRLYVTGSSITYGNNLGDLATVAYNAGSGSQAWAARYNQSGYDWDTGVALAAAPDSKTVFAAGTLHRASGDFSDIGVVAYAA